ncbi:MAG: GNAT family N-acetyltransferase [Bacteroidota bacterium]
MASEHIIINNEKQLHFEFHEGDEIAFIEYRFHNNNIALMHTLVPKSMEGKGIASALAAYAFKYAKEHNKPVMVYCPYISTYLKRHPELLDQIASKD